MKQHLIFYILMIATLIRVSHVNAASSADFVNLNDVRKECEKTLKNLPGKSDSEFLKKACAQIEVLPTCVSAEKRVIYHYNKKSSDSSAKNVMVISLIHGDETLAGSVGRYWMEQLEQMEPRNNWRVIPVLNPDGYVRKTRTNAHNIDINRNFPTKDWEDQAIAHWKKTTHSNPRRFPGSIAGSEPETVCTMKEIDDFKPDFIVSIHTPLTVLDYDGPKLKSMPKFDYLPWRSLGSYPGSLGRYMWLERETPVLTMELKSTLPNNMEPIQRLQNIIGTLVQIEKERKTKSISFNGY